MNMLKRHFYMLLRLALGLGLLVYLSASDVMDWERLAGLGRAWPLALAALGCLALAAIGLGAWRLCLLMRPHRLHLSFAASARLTLIGLFFNTCLPGATGGDVVKIYYAMQGNGGRRLEIATVMMLDRVAGLLGILSFTLVLAFFFRPMLAAFAILNRLVWAAGASLVIVLAIIGCCTSDYGVWRRVVAWAARALPGGDYLRRIIDTLRVYRAHPKAACQVIGASMAVHFFLTVATLLVIQATHPSGAESRMMMLIPMGFMANTLPVTPGGLGVGEAAFDKLFNIAGFSGGAVAIFGWRVLMMIIGLPGLLVYLVDKKQAVVAAQTPLMQDSALSKEERE